MRQVPARERGNAVQDKVPETLILGVVVRPFKTNTPIGGSLLPDPMPPAPTLHAVRPVRQPNRR